MELRIWNDIGLEGGKINQVYLRLKPVYNGVAIVACRENGSEYDLGYLVKLTERGKIGLYDHVNPRLGFSLDETGTIILEW